MNSSLSRRPSAALVICTRMLFGGWFLYSGGVKWFVSGLDQFTRDIANYRMVVEPWDALAAYCVPAMECVAGLCLLFGVLRRGALLAVALLVGIFSVSVGWAWFHQLDISCGCHGGDAPIQYWAKFLEFTGYTVLMVWFWRMENAGKLTFFTK